MSFEANISNHIKELHTKRRKLESERSSLLHDCEYCDMSGDVTEEDQEAFDKLAVEIKGVDKAIESIKAHAKLHKIDFLEPAGYNAVSVVDMPLERTTHEKMVELMQDQKYDVLYMRSEQWVKLMGESLVPADEKIYYRGVEVRFRAAK